MMYQRRTSERSAQSMVEFALVLPFISILLVSVFELARGALIGITLENCAREGARYASTHPDTSTAGLASIVAAAKALDAIAAPTGNVSIVVSPVTGGTLASGSAVRVTVICQFSSMLGSLIFPKGSTFTLSKQSTMTVE